MRVIVYSFEDADGVTASDWITMDSDAGGGDYAHDNDYDMIENTFEFAKSEPVASCKYATWRREGKGKPNG